MVENKKVILIDWYEIEQVADGITNENLEKSLEYEKEKPSWREENLLLM